VAKAVNENVVKATYTKNGSYDSVVYCEHCGAELSRKKVSTPKLEKKANTLSVKGKTVTVKYSKLKKSNQSVSKDKALTVSKAQGKVTYSKTSGNKKITINKTSGKITVKKGLKKGTYKVKIKVSAAGNSTYKALSKTVTVTIKVK
jgi:endo-1,4-beta-xylanase